MPRPTGPRPTGRPSTGRADEGATLAELLAGVAVLGVLVTAAVPAHRGAVDLALSTAATSDARQAATIAAVAGLEGGSPVPTTVLLDDEAVIAAQPSPFDEFRRSGDVRTRVWTVPEHGGSRAPAGFCVAAHHSAAGTFVLFDSVHGLVGRALERAQPARATSTLLLTLPCARNAAAWAPFVAPAAPGSGTA